MLATKMTTQVTSIGGIGPYQAPGHQVREVSYQPGSKTLLLVTIQVTSIGSIGPYRALERQVREVSYQPGSEMLLSGLY